MLKKTTAPASTPSSQVRVESQDSMQSRSAQRRLRVEEFFDHVVAEVPALPPGLADHLSKLIGTTKQIAGANVAIRKAIEEATRDA